MINNPTTTFQIKSAFQLTGKQFFVLGDILSGAIREGMEADLTSIGIDKRPIIETIEFVLTGDRDNVWEEVALGFSNLTETEKDFIKSQSPFSKSILIVEKTY